MIQFKHSQVSGNVPNLVPGQIGINEADEVLWLRADGKKVAVDINKVRNYAAPLGKAQDGAPLVKTDAGSEWVPSLAPSSVVNGAITVDASQSIGIYGIPGVMITGIGADYAVTGSRAICEHFYVASDEITIDRIFFYVGTQTIGSIRAAIADDDDQIVAQGQLSSPSSNATNFVSLTANLKRGHYRAIFWSTALKTLREITGVSFDQGWNLDGSGNMLFLDREFSDGANFSSGIDISGIGFSPTTSQNPGIRRLLAYHWSIPA